MSSIKHSAATLLYVLPSIALAFGAIEFFGFDPKLAALGGLIACLLGAEAHAAISRSIERKQVRQELQELTSLAAGLSRDLDDAADKIVEMEERFERETAERMERIFSEIRVIESLVKRLAETRAASTVAAATEAPAIEASAPAAGTAHATPDSDVPPPEPTRGIEQMDDAELLDAIRRSLETNRVDLYLQPVVSLPQRKVLYYEGLSRLRTDKGELIMPRDYMRVAEPAGMMPAVDNILLFRCIQVVRKLAQRNSKAGVFCNISAFSLLDSDFFPQFIEYMQHNKDLAQHLIFEFSQMTVNGAGPVEQASFEALAALGFRFSMDQVTSLKLDPKVLHDRNFRFLKVSAETLLDGRQMASGDIDAGDLKELLRRNGIQLIADKVEAEREVVDILDLNVELGQGFLFGEPRPVRESALREDAPALSIAAD